MRRTSSGSDLAGSTLFSTESTTPYVYMAAQSDSFNAPMSPAVDPFNDPSIFHRHCGGGTVRVLHSSSAVSFTFPPGFDVVVADGFLTATIGQGHDPIFSVPIGSILRAQLLRAAGPNAGLWSLLCGCCYGGSREKVLALDLDAPLGWIQWEEHAARNIAGPVRLGLYVLDDQVEEYLDAMGLSLG